MGIVCSEELIYYFVPLAVLEISRQVNKALQNKTFTYTCWMNAALQALAATPLHLMLKGKPHINTDPAPTYI